MVSVYTSTNGTFEWTITNDTTYDSSEDIAIYQSAFDRWDSVVTMNERFDHTITFSISITDMGSGVLGSAWISSHKIIDTDTGVITTTTDYNAGTFGNKVPFTANINMNYSYLPSYKADIRDDGFSGYYHVVVHEVGHILGIGSYWHLTGTPKTSYTDNDGSTVSLYTGVNAVREYNYYFNTNHTGVPIENNGGGGTANVHGEETGYTLADGTVLVGMTAELMTGWIDSSPAAIPLSRISIAYLDDLGWTVDYTKADTYMGKDGPEPPTPPPEPSIITISSTSGYMVSNNNPPQDREYLETDFNSLKFNDTYTDLNTFYLDEASNNTWFLYYLTADSKKIYVNNNTIVGYINITENVQEAKEFELLTDTQLPNNIVFSVANPRGTFIKSINEDLYFVLHNGHGKASLLGPDTGMPWGGLGTVERSNEFHSYNLNYPPGVLPICFPKGTPVLTNLGDVAIEKLNPDKHTIRGKEIVAITQSSPLQKHIVCFEKDSLSKNVPSQQTLCSMEHKVFYKGEMTKARNLVDLCENVTFVPYNGETLYNVLLKKQDKMMINNLICETLHPENIAAKISQMKDGQKKNKVIQELSKIIKENNVPEYQKLYASL